MSATLPVLLAFKDHLKAHLTEWEVDLMPQNPEEYYLAHPNGAVLISYVASKFDKPQTTQHIVQKRTLTLVFTVLCRDLHETNGALNLLDKLRVLITGFRAPSCNEAWLVEEQFDGEVSGIWHYQLVVSTDTMQVQQFAPTTAPNLAQLVTRTKQAPLDKRVPKQAG